MRVGGHVSRRAAGKAAPGRWTRVGRGNQTRGTGKVSRRQSSQRRARLCFLWSLKRSLASQEALVVKKPPANAGDLRNTGSLPGLGRPPGERNGTLLQYSCLENPMDGGAWWAQSGTRLKRLSTHSTECSLIRVVLIHSGCFLTS